MLEQEDTSCRAKQLPPWCYQPRNKSSSGHPATDKRQDDELACPA